MTGIYLGYALLLFPFFPIHLTTFFKLENRLLSQSLCPVRFIFRTVDFKQTSGSVQRRFPYFSWLNSFVSRICAAQSLLLVLTEPSILLNCRLNRVSCRLNFNFLKTEAVNFFEGVSEVAVMHSCHTNGIKLNFDLIWFYLFMICVPMLLGVPSRISRHG